MDDQGNRCPTKDTAAIFTFHNEMHRAPAYWVRPDHFLPERWLADCYDGVQLVKEAFRAFEVGPRNCVAQGLIMTELQVMLACLARQFDLTPAYAERDRPRPGQGLRIYRGERVCHPEEGAARPVEHYPCRVMSFRSYGWAALTALINQYVCTRLYDITIKVCSQRN